MAGTMVSAVSRSADGSQLGPLFARESKSRDDFWLLQSLRAASLQGDLRQAVELRGREDPRDGRFVGPDFAKQPPRPLFTA